MLCAIWYHNVKNTHVGVLLLVNLQPEAWNITKSDTPPSVFFTLFKLYKCNQIAQTSHVYQSMRKTQNSSIMRQKGESQNGGYKKTKPAKFSEKETFLVHLIRTYTLVLQKIWLALFSCE